MYKNMSGRCIINGGIGLRYYCDIVVVGAGPGGSMAAKYAAENGAEVILIEKKAEIGAPLRCAEGISKKELVELGIKPDPTWICSSIKGAIIKSPSGITLRFGEKNGDTEVGYILERHIFDKYLAEEASMAGAKIMLRTGCTGILKDDNGKIIGIRARSMGEKIEIYAKCVIAADGYESQVGRWAGIDTSIDLNDVDTCIQYRMTNIVFEKNLCEFVVGSMAPGGYIWIFPKGRNVANVGIGIMASRCKHKADPKYFLDKFIEGDPRFRNGQILEITGGMVSTIPGLDRTTTDGLILVGDAARMIDPNTGGGIAHACKSGKFAGEVSVNCLRKMDFSREVLAAYEKMWRNDMEDKLCRNWMVKERFVTLTDEELDDIIKRIGDLSAEEVNIQNLLKIIKERLPNIIAGLECII
ncbi:MAG: NAD(P)/FAD-dependent oxidoreductase [archaeon]|nr:NAD(P)/FAD-dependent oxidoreductase [archaeon]